MINFFSVLLVMLAGPLFALVAPFIFLVIWDRLCKLQFLFCFAVPALVVSLSGQSLDVISIFDHNPTTKASFLMVSCAWFEIILIVIAPWAWMKIDFDALRRRFPDPAEGAWGPSLWKVKFFRECTMIARNMRNSGHQKIIVLIVTAFMFAPYIIDGSFFENYRFAIPAALLVANMIVLAVAAPMYVPFTLWYYRNK